MKRLSCLTMLALWVACSSGSPSDVTGAVTLSLTNVPAGIACVKVTLVGAATLDRLQPVSAGQSATFTLEDLPLGASTLTASAYEAACSVLATAPPAWRSAPASVTITAEEATGVLLVLQRVLDADAGPADAGPVDAEVVDAGPPEEPDAGPLPPGVTRVDITAGRGERTGIAPSLVLDTKNNKLLVTATDDTNGQRLGLYRCELDGSQCSFVDLGVGQPALSGYRSQPLIDTANDKLLVLRDDHAGPERFAVGLTRCALDGSACSHTRLSPEGYGGPAFSSAVLDTANQRLIAVTSTWRVPTGAPPVRDQGYEYHCALDGSQCTSRMNLYYNTPVLLADAQNARLYTVGSAWRLRYGNVFVERCGLDGTGCNDASPGQSGAFGDPLYGQSIDSKRVALLKDEANARLTVIVDSNGDDQSALRAIRCNLDLTDCPVLTVPLPNGPARHDVPQAVLDTANNQLLVVVGTTEVPWLLRCDPALTACTSTQLGAGGPYAQTLPSIALDAANRRLLVVTQTASGRLALTKVEL